MADNSFVDSPFYSHDSSNQSKSSDGVLGTSLLSEDQSVQNEESFASAQTSQHDESMKNDYLTDDEYEEDSFLVADSPESKDDTFESSHMSSFESRSPVARRVQPARFAKHDLNTPVRKRKSAIKREPVEIIVKSSPCENEADEDQQPATMSCREYIHPTLVHLGPEERALMLELYPEMARPPSATAEVKEESDSDPEEKLNASMVSMHITPRTKQRNKRITMTQKILTFEEDEIEAAVDSDGDGRKYNHFVNVKTEKLDDFELVIEEVSPDEAPEDKGTPLTSGNEDSFEQYLRSLKKSPPRSSKPPRESISRFVVDDEEPVSDFSLEDEDDESEATDEELSDEGCSSEDEDESIIAVDKENIPITSKKAIPKELASSLLKTFHSPSLKKVRKKINDDDYFIASLSEQYDRERHDEAHKYVTKGLKSKALREQLTTRLFDIFQRNCFNNELQMEATDVSWNVRLTKTAGHCKSRCTRSNDGPDSVKVYKSDIELSVKVITTAARLRDTLVHEMCHAATFLIDKVPKAGHGPLWKSWAARCRKGLPSLQPISRCHNYKIDAKYQYECSGCGQLVKRHSKSFDTNKYRCGRCKGEFVLKVQNAYGAEANPRPPSKFALFVKDNYGSHKKNGRSHKEVMGELSNKWKSMNSLRASSQEDLS